MTTTPARSKVLPLDALAAKVAALRRAGKKVVLCHGVFDPMHIGHVRHFEAAKAKGDVLVVTVTPDRFVNKGPHRPYFGEDLRAESAAALSCVDFAAVNRWPSAVETLKLLKPSVYAKGSDYRDAKADVTGGIKREAAAARAGGGRLRFTDEIVFSSTHLVNRRLSALPPETAAWLEGFRRRRPLRDVLAPLSKASSLKILVIGEAIVDEYVYVEAIGKSSKEPTLVVKRLETEPFAGGSLAVANHAAAFGGRVGLLTFLGSSDTREGFIRKKLRKGVSPRFLYRPDSPTIVKRRYVERYHFTKLLETYFINDARMTPREDAALVAALKRELPRHDLVVVVDYGHGMLNEAAIRLIEREAKHLVVNAQMNAGNLGYHTIGRYRRADLVCITEGELRMEMRDRRGDLRPLVRQFAKKTRFKRLLVTRGKTGSLAWDSREGFSQAPAIAGRVKDRVGAGDAFLTAAAVWDRLGAPLEVSALAGNAAGAQAVATVGNRDFLDKAALAKHLESLLK